MENYDQLSKDIKSAAYFVVAVLSPSTLISFLCLLFYLFTVFPELKEPFINSATKLFSSIKAKTSSTEDNPDSEANLNDLP